VPGGYLSSQGKERRKRLLGVYVERQVSMILFPSPVENYSSSRTKIPYR
jgi:hypothetical protein